MDLPTCTSKLGSLYQRRHHKSSSTLKNLNPFLKRSKPLSTNPPPCSTTLEASFRSVATNSRNINTKKHAPSWFKRYLPRRNKEAYSLEIEAIAREAVDKYLRASSIEYEQRKPAMKMKESEDYLTVKFPNPWTGVLSPYVEDEKRAGYIETESKEVTAMATCVRRTAPVVQRKPVGLSVDSTTSSHRSSILGGPLERLVTGLLAMVEHVFSVAASASSASRTLSDPKVRLNDLFAVCKDWGLAVVYSIVLLYLLYLVCGILAFWLKVGRCVVEPLRVFGLAVSKLLG